MSLWSNRNWRWTCPVLLLGGLLAATSPAYSDDSAAPESGPAVDDPAAEKGAAGDSDAADDDTKKADGTQGRALPAVPMAVPAWQFGGRFRAFFGRNAGFAAPVAEATESEDEPPRNVVLPDNGDMRRRLERVKGQIADGHFADAARHLGQMLQNSEIRDFFLTQGEDRRDSRSFQTEIRQLIGALPTEGRTAYLAQFEGVARQQLAAALEKGGESALRDVAARFPLTAAGNEALYRLSHYLWEHGRPAAAIACLQRVQIDPAAATPFEPALSQLMAACRARVGQAPSGAIRDEWTTYRGNPERNRSSVCRPPLLAARWTRDVAVDPRTRRSIGDSMNAYREGRGTRVPLLHPLAINDLVLMRTARGVAAIDLATGNRLWQHPTDDDSDNAGFDQVLWSEPAGGAFSADAECFYLLERGRTVGGSSLAGPNSLIAREHHQSRQGRLRWRVGGADGGDEPALAGVSFLGPAVAWQGRLYVQVEGKEAISLVVLDARTGRLEWSQELALVEQPLRADAFRQLAGASPSISAEEIIVCPTAGGAVVAVDLTTQALLWAYRYARRPQTSIGGGGEGDGEPTTTRLDQHERWLDGTATLGRDCVILTPPESNDVHCLDLRDGHLRWSRPRGEGGLFVACLSERLAVVAFKATIQALSLADGQPVWETAIPDGALISGRGVFSGDRYFLPVTSGGVLQIDMSTGAISATLRSTRETALGNLIWHRGVFLSQSPDYLQAFDEHDAVDGQVREALDKNPRDAVALLRRGDLELSAGRIAGAIAAFREANRLQPSPSARAKLTSVLLDALRQDGNDRELLRRELDDLLEMH